MEEQARVADTRGLRSRASAAPSPQQGVGAGRAILNGALSLASATAVTSALGVVYWWVAARQFSEEAVGFAGAAISAMTLVATFVALGLGTLLMGELSRATDTARELLRNALVIVVVGSALLGLLYAVVAPAVSTGLDPLAAGPLTVVLFTCGAVVTALGMVLDQALLGLARGRLQLMRNVVLSVVKLLVLVGVGLAVTGGSGMAIYATWTIGGACSLLLVAAAARGRPLTVDHGGDRTRSRLAAMREVARSAASHQSLNLGLRLPILLLPVFVVGWVSATANSRFYIDWMITNFAFVLPGALATILYAASAADPSSLPEKLRFSLKASVGLTVLATVGLIALAEPMLSVFGSGYTDGTAAMRILALSGVALVAKNHYVAVVRARQETGHAQLLVWAGSGLELLLAGGGAIVGGLEGLCLGWVLAVWVEAALMLPTVRGAVRTAT